jgi:hypothetical protein
MEIICNVPLNVMVWLEAPRISTFPTCTPARESWMNAPIAPPDVPTVATKVSMAPATKADKGTETVFKFPEAVIVVDVRSDTTVREGITEVVISTQVDPLHCHT